MRRACSFGSFSQEQSLYRQLHADILGHIQEDPAVPDCAVKGSYTMLILGNSLHEIRLHQIAVLTDGCF
ncbi:hypothetical protein D3C75_1288580 [compost metagenome]